MTVEEFSYQFDVSLRTFSQVGTLALDEYEKSVYLTMAQESLVKQAYEQFEKDEQAREVLKPLIKTKNAQMVSLPDGQDVIYFDKYKTSFWSVEDTVWWIVYEQATLYDECLADCYNGKIADIKVARVDELNAMLKNPFLRPNEHKVIRIDPYGEEKPYMELISKYTVDSYRVRYITKPEPIILQDLPDDLSINGVKTA